MTRMVRRAWKCKSFDGDGRWSSPTPTVSHPSRASLIQGVGEGFALYCSGRYPGGREREKRFFAAPSEDGGPEEGRAHRIVATRVRGARPRKVDCALRGQSTSCVQYE